MEDGEAKMVPMDGIITITGEIKIMDGEQITNGEIILYSIFYFHYFLFSIYLIYYI
jgi:hypothetical protein